MSDSALKELYAKHIKTCSSVVSCTWLLWDLCLTLGQEVEFAWPLSWSLMKSIYYMIRWFSVLIQLYCLFRDLALGAQAISGRAIWFLQPHLCLIWKAAYLLALFCVNTSVEYVLLIRVWALYSRNRRLKRTLFVVFILRMLWVIVTTTSYITILAGKLKAENAADLCTASPSSTTLIGTTCWSLLYHSLLFALMLIKFVTSFRGGWRNTPIMLLLMRDGTWSFFLLFAFSVIFLLCLLFLDPTITPAFYCWLNSTISFVGYRNLLNIFKFSRTDSSVLAEQEGGMQHRFSTDVFAQQFLSDASPEEPGVG